jgi:hypothetical protein
MVAIAPSDPPQPANQLLLLQYGIWLGLATNFWNPLMAFMPSPFSISLFACEDIGEEASFSHLLPEASQSK